MHSGNRIRLFTVRLALQQRGLDSLADRLHSALGARCQQQADQLARLALRLAAVDPHQVLSRGYAWLTDGSGRPVSHAAGLQAGVQLGAQWADGSAAVQVLSVALGPPGQPD